MDRDWLATEFEAALVADLCAGRVDRLAHLRDTTLEKRSPDHRERIGAPVQHLLAFLKGERNISAQLRPAYAEQNGRKRGFPIGGPHGVRGSRM